MVASESIVGSPADFLTILPKELLSKQVSRAYKKAVARLDDLLFLDEFGELAVDRDTFIKFVRDRDVVPVEIADVAMLETTKHLGRRLKQRKNGLQIKWLESAKYGLPIAPLSVEKLEELTQGRQVSEKDLDKFVRRVLPDVPKFWTRSDSGAIRSDLIKGSLENRTYWECLVAHLGFWAALVLIGSHVVFFALLAISWQVALLWAVVYSGVATAYVLLQCAANTEWK